MSIRGFRIKDSGSRGVGRQSAVGSRQLEKPGISGLTYQTSARNQEPGTLNILTAVLCALCGLFAWLFPLRFRLLAEGSLQSAVSSQQSHNFGASFRVGHAGLFMRNLAVWCGALILLVASSCNEPHKQKPVIVDSKKLKENIVNVNKPAVVMEQDEINAWIHSHGYAMKSTGTGLRYYIFKENPKGKQIKLKSIVKIKYKVSLLDGTLCYSSDEKGPREFAVGADNVESGVHEMVQLMREGEKSIFILPSHLAFGLKGDMKKIPPKTAVVYEVEISEVN